MEEEKTKTGYSTWVLEENPLYFCKCPHCGNDIIMTREPLITRLKKWAKMLKLIFK